MPLASRARSRRILFPVVISLLLVGVALTWWGRSTSEVRREAGLSVLLITIDTLRADAVGAYGNRAAQTPWMDRVAAGGVRFDAAHAHNVVTLPSHANILAGRYPFEHGVRDNAGFRFPSDIETVATLLAARGYRTGAFVSAFPLDSRYGLARGFDVYDDSFVGATNRPAFLIQERSGADTVARARRWLDGQQGAASFCWVHLYEPHYPYLPPEPFASRFATEPYHGDVAAADAALAPLIQPLLAAGENGRTLVVLTSDHGESLGDHGETTHGIFAYEPVLRVPLVLFQPRLFAPRVVESPARHIDLLPTVLDALSIPIPEGLPGRSLLAAAAGRPLAIDSPAYFEALSGSLNRGWAPLHGLLRRKTKYIDLPIPELYDVHADPSEQRNVAPQEKDTVDDMRQQLEALRAGEREVARRRETAEARERLKSLGYVTAVRSRGRERYTEADDPKRLIGLDTKLQEVVGRYLDGDLRGATDLCREIAAQRADAVTLMYLAHLERENGNLSVAVDALSRAVALDPDDSETTALLGAYLIQSGRAREALALLDAYANDDAPDVQVLVSRALALAHVGRQDDAQTVLARARTIDSSDGMLLVESGTIHLMAGNREQAARAFAEAVALNPGIARAHSSLGVVAAERGRPAEAIGHWKRATAIDPAEYGKLLALGGSLANAGRSAEARTYFEFFAASAPPSRYARELARVREWLIARTR